MFLRWLHERVNDTVLIDGSSSDRYLPGQVVTGIVQGKGSSHHGIRLEISEQIVSLKTVTKVESFFKFLS